MTDAPRAPLVVATSNRGKLREIRALLARSGRPVLSLADVSAPVPIVETGRSYLENAIAKAVAVVDETRLMTLADDSGLEVEALGGRPGVTSARYGGPLATDRERCARLLGELQDVPRARRRACFRAVVALAVPAGQRFAREGVLEGRIALGPRGENGFGYDPVFELGNGRTLAEIGDEKQELSHRFQALRGIIDLLEELP